MTLVQTALERTLAALGLGKTDFVRAEDVPSIMADIGTIDVTATGSETSRTLADWMAGSQGEVSIYEYGYVDGGDLGAAVNAAIAAGYAAGGKIIRIPAGEYTLSTSIVPKSYCPVVGDGEQLTIINVATDAPYAQTSGSSLYGAGICDVTFKATSGHDDAVVLSLTAAVRNRFERLRFDGFTTGKILRVAGATVTDQDESILPVATSNTVWNTFRDWMVIGCATGLELFGKYGSTPTASPANSANVPSIVLSKNVYDNLTFWGVSGTGIDIIGACDHEVWGHISINFSANNAVGVKIGSDATYTGNNYANNHEFPELVFSKSASETGLVGVSVPCWTFGNGADIKDDITSGLTPFTVTSSSQSHNFYYRAVVSNGKTRVVRESKDWTDASNNGAAAVYQSRRVDAHGDSVKVFSMLAGGVNDAAAQVDYGRFDVYCLQDAAGTHEGQVRLGAPMAGTMADHLWLYKGATGIRDGISEPPTGTGITWIYVDTADGDLKVKFGDGTVKTIATDT